MRVRHTEGTGMVIIIIIIIIGSTALGGSCPPLRFRTNIFFYGMGLFASRPTPQPGGPEYLFLSVSSSLTCLAW